MKRVELSAKRLIPNEGLRTIIIRRGFVAASRPIADTCPFSVLSYSCSLGPKYWTIRKFWKAND
jgi:hypothetical protein